MEKVYEIEVDVFKTENILLSAESKKQLLQKIKQRYSTYNSYDYRIKAIDGRTVIGICELTGDPIFDSDDYLEDYDGGMYLKSAFK